jgi:hypothetical protein
MFLTIETGAGVAGVETTELIADAVIGGHGSPVMR